MAKTITLTASSDFQTAGKQFVARITGRDSKFTFAREFLGRRSGKRQDYTSADIDEPSLYEVRDTTRKGTDDAYHLIWEDGGDLIDTDLNKSDAMRIAKNLPADWSVEGRRMEIASLEESVNAGRAKDQDAIISIQFAVGLVGPGDVKRSDLLAARVAEIERLKAVR